MNWSTRIRTYKDKYLNVEKQSTYNDQEICLSSCLFFLQQKDEKLAQIVEACPNLPDHIVAAVKALVQAYFKE
jgi:hypothetical protein